MAYIPGKTDPNADNRPKDCPVLQNQMVFCDMKECHILGCPRRKTFDNKCVYVYLSTTDNKKNCKGCDGYRMDCPDHTTHSQRVAQMKAEKGGSD